MVPHSRGSLLNGCKTQGEYPDTKVSGSPQFPPKFPFWSILPTLPSLLRVGFVWGGCGKHCLAWPWWKERMDKRHGQGNICLASRIKGLSSL